MSAEPTTPSPSYSLTNTREAWLLRAVDLMRPKLVEVYEGELPVFRVSIGYPPNARSESRKILGVTVTPEAVSDGVAEIYISPEDADTAGMLNTLLHNLVHVLVGTNEGHRGRFAEVAIRLGFEGALTDTIPNMDLAVDLMLWAAELGEYPGGQVNIPSRARRSTPRPVLVGVDGSAVRVTSGAATQTNRNIGIICPSCGWSGRTYAKWIGEDGDDLPICNRRRVSAEGHPIVDAAGVQLRCNTQIILK